MKISKILLFTVASFVFYACSTEKKSQTFNIFGAKISASEVVGTSRFEDVGIRYYTSVIPNLSEDTTTYLWRMGTVRVSSNYYPNGTYPLFSLSSREHPLGFPLLDTIDREYYLSYGHQILELKNPSLLNEVKYKELLKIMRTKSVKDFRTALFGEYAEYRESFINSRYFINDQIISDSIVKKVLNETKINLSVSTSIDQIVSDAIAADSASSRSSDSAKLSALIKRVLNKQTALHGFYRSVNFRHQYVDIANEIISSKNEKEIDTTNLFGKNLRFYIESKNNALNTFMAAFKFSGQFNSQTAVYDSIKAAIQAQFHFADSQAASVAAAVSHQYVKSINESFSNSFSKLWIIVFGTEQLMDKLVFKGQTPRQSLNNKRKEDIGLETPYYPRN